MMTQQTYKFMDLYDNEGNQLTIEQEEYFKNTIVKDINTDLVVVYHSSKAKFNEFDINCVNLNDNKLPAFWFTNNKDRRYSFGENSIQAYINLINPINTAKITLTLEQINSLADSSMSKEQLSELIKEKRLDSDYDLIYYFAPKENNLLYNNYVQKIIDITNYDGYVYNDWVHKEITYAVFKSNQIKLITNKLPTFSNNINE